MDNVRIIVVLAMATIICLGEATVFTVVNNCKETVWPGVLPGNKMADGGFSLNPGESVTLYPPAKWSGRLWGRTGCTFDASGQGSCQTGNCGGALRCSGAGGDPPVSLVELTLNSGNASKDYYDVSLVDGYNLPLSVRPVNGDGNCTTAGDCKGDLRESCPAELALKVQGRVVACMSACDRFNSSEYCCTGGNATPQTCHPTVYSKMFKKACPTAYSYAYDDPSSIFTCTRPDYIITFCPAEDSGKTPGNQPIQQNNSSVTEPPGHQPIQQNNNSSATKFTSSKASEGRESIHHSFIYLVHLYLLTYLISPI